MISALAKSERVVGMAAKETPEKAIMTTISVIDALNFNTCIANSFYILTGRRAWQPPSELLQVHYI
jgi:hypothetical protein